MDVCEKQESGLMNARIKDAQKRRVFGPFLRGWKTLFPCKAKRCSHF